MCYFDILIIVLVYILLDVELSKLVRRRYSRTLSVGVVNLRLFDKNIFVLNNVYFNKMEYFYVKFVFNGIVICDVVFSL